MHTLSAPAPAGAADDVLGDPLPLIEKRGLIRGRSWRLAGLVLALGVLVLVMLVSIAVGAKPISLRTVVDAVVHHDDTIADHLIIRTLRVPRTVVGVLVGVALGLAGAVMQGVARNPLADPGILGVNAGAALLVVVAIAAFGITSLSGSVWFAFAGAAAAAVFVYAIGSTGREGATPVKLALAGAAVTALVGSITTAVVLLDPDTLDQFRFWTVGSLAGRTDSMIWQIAPFIAVGSAMALASGRMLNTLTLGDDIARSLGLRVGLVRALSCAAVVVLVGAATAVAGPIAFVGLTVAHMARAITGPDYRWVLPYSAVLAPILLLSADVIGRVIARPGEVEVGIVSALLGAPFFVILVRRRRLAGL